MTLTSFFWQDAFSKDAKAQYASSLRRVSLYEAASTKQVRLG